MSDGTSALLNAVYVSSSEGEKILKKLTKAAGFSTDNIISRLALARSLADELPLAPAADWEADHRAGKQIKGFTLLGRQEVANSLLAMIVEAEGQALGVDDLRQRVRLRWEHGLRLMDREIRTSNMESILLTYVERAVLSEGQRRSPTTLSPRRVLGEAVVGQPQAKKLVEEVLDRAIDHDPARIAKPLCLVGPPGSGKRTMARGIARALQLPFVELPARDCVDAEVMLTRLEWQLAIDGLAPWATKADRIEYPGAILYVSEAEHLADEQMSWILRFNPSRTYQDLNGMRIRMIAGGVIFGAARELAGLELVPFLSYSVADIAEVVGRAIGKWPLEMRRLLAIAGRLNPADSIARGRELLQFARDATAGGRPSEGLLLDVMEKHWGMDRLGMTAANYSFLGDVANGSQPKEESSEATFLERMGFVRWRDDEFSLTDRGREVLDVWLQFRS